MYRFFLTQQVRQAPSLALGGLLPPGERVASRQDYDRFLVPVERRLMQAVILGHATVGNEDGAGDMACYHVHPRLHPPCRALLNKLRWTQARFALVGAAQL